ncbi:hypothetical protein ykris0001_41870 [Yersinia kristensenii ATCC 33638]|nr:hypothetical protein ykris0001_41870 [Yersinia kristensenii ATCC 33638]
MDICDFPMNKQSFTVYCCNKQQTAQLFCSMDWGECQITVH